MEKPRHVPIRHDIFQLGLRPEELAVFVCVASASTLGVSTYSPRKLARLTMVDVEGIEGVLNGLAYKKTKNDKPLIRWWPDEEIVWAIDRAYTTNVAGLAWVAARREWACYPECVRDAIAERYPVLLSDAMPKSAGGTGQPPRSRGRITKSMRRSVLQRDGNKCTYCGSIDDLVMDHFVPVSKGGQTSVDNLVAACADCNAAKSDMMPDEWIG